LEVIRGFSSSFKHLIRNRIFHTLLALFKKSLDDYEWPLARAIIRFFRQSHQIVPKPSKENPWKVIHPFINQCRVFRGTGEHRVKPQKCYRETWVVDG